MSSAIQTVGVERLSRVSTIGLPFAIGYYFAFRVFITLLSVTIFGTSPQVGSGINLAFNFLLLIFAVFCCVGEARWPFTHLARLPSVRWAFLFLGFSGCSLLWSSTASMAAAIAFWCGMAADVAMVILVLRANPYVEVLESLMKGYVCGACVVAIIAWLMPAQSDLRLGNEELLGPNQIGYLCAFAFFFAQYLIMREKRRTWVPAAVLLAITLLRSLSKTSIVAFVVSETFLLVRDKSMSRRTKLAVVLAGGVLVAAFWGLLASYYEIYSDSESQVETLTGRLGIWAYILADAVQKPWIGHGFHSVWKVIPPFGADQFEARHAHSELLQQFYAYGAVGVCMFAGIYGSLINQIRRLAGGPLKTFLFAFLLFVLLRGVTDTEPFDLSLPLWGIVLISPLIARAGTRSNSPFEIVIRL